MFAPARYIADFARFAATKGAQEQHDIDALGELERRDLALPAGLSLRCGPVFGIHIEVAGASFYHQGSANLIDDAIRQRGADYFLAGSRVADSLPTTGAGSSRGCSRA